MTYPTKTSVERALPVLGSAREAEPKFIGRINVPLCQQTITLGPYATAAQRAEHRRLLYDVENCVF